MGHKRKSPDALNEKHLSLLPQGRYGPIVANPKKAREASLHPLVREERRKEAEANAQASAWCRDTLAQFFSADERAFSPHTTGQLLTMLDEWDEMPSAWARLVKSETPAYTKRYDMVRNSLEALARKRAVVGDHYQCSWT